MSKQQVMPWVRTVLMLVGIAAGVAVLYSRLVLVEYRLTQVEASVKALVETKGGKIAKTR